MKARLLAVLLVFAGGVPGAPAVKVGTASPVRLTGGFVAAVPPGSGTSAAYLTLVNSSNRAVRLTHATTSVAQQTLLMNTTRETSHDSHSSNADVMVGMKRADALVIPARGRLVMKADGDHLMLLKLKRSLKAGERVNVTLHFSSGPAETVTVPVRRPV